MSYPVNYKVNPYSQQSSGLSTESLQNLNTEKIQQDVNQEINDHPVSKMVKDDPILKTGLSAAIWFAIAKGMERFNKACATRVDGKANLLDKVRDFGDKIGEQKIFQSKVFNKLSELAKKAKSLINEKVINQSAILKSLIYTPTEPRFQMPRIMIKGTLGETANDATQAFTAWTQNVDGTYDLAKLKKLGLTAEKLEEMCKNDSAYVDDIIKICRQMQPDEFVELAEAKKAFTMVPKGTTIKTLFRDRLLGKDLYTQLFGRRIYFSELANKLEALKGLKGTYGKTPLGKILPKTFLRVTEGLTNGTAGGKFAIIMQAMCFADAIIRTMQAPNSEKGKTFAESAITDLAFYLAIPTTLSVLYHLGGLKYIGLDKAGVENYRKALEEFNKKAEAGLFTKAEWKQGKKALKDMLKGDTKLNPKVDDGAKTAWKCIKNIVHKPIKWAARVITVGLETKSGLLKQGANQMENSLLRNKSSLFKRGAGFPVRFVLGSMVFLPFFSHIATRVSHLIFGRPTNSLLDEDKAEKEEQKQKQPTQLVMPTQAQSSAKQNAAVAKNNITPIQRENLLDLYGAKLAHNSIAPVQSENLNKIHNNKSAYNMTATPVQRENLIDMYKAPQEPVRTYVPSSVSVIGNDEDKEKNDKAIAALKRADAVVKSASQYT